MQRTAALEKLKNDLTDRYDIYLVIERINDLLSFTRKNILALTELRMALPEVVSTNGESLLTKKFEDLALFKTHFAFERIMDALHPFFLSIKGDKLAIVKTVTALDYLLFVMLSNECLMDIMPGGYPRPMGYPNPPFQHPWPTQPYASQPPQQYPSYPQQTPWVNPQAPFINSPISYPESSFEPHVRIEPHPMDFYKSEVTQPDTPQTYEHLDGLEDLCVDLEKLPRVYQFIHRVLLPIMVHTPTDINEVDSIIHNVVKFFEYPEFIPHLNSIIQQLCAETKLFDLENLRSRLSVRVFLTEDETEESLSKLPRFIMGGIIKNEHGLPVSQSVELQSLRQDGKKVERSVAFVLEDRPIDEDDEAFKILQFAVATLK